MRSIDKSHYAGVLAAALFMLVLPFQNCADTRFSSNSSAAASAADGGGGAACESGGCLGDDPRSQFANIDVGGTILQPGNSCSTFLQNTALGIRTLFVIDRSGSNQSLDNGPGTDPGKVYRGASLNEFFNLYKAKANFSWGLNVFDGSAQALINTGSTASPRITSVAGEMSSAISAFLASGEGSGTNYKIALAMVANQVAADPARNSSSRYVIVFMSDGLPNKGYEAVNDTLTVKGMDEMLTDIQNLIKSLPGQISLNTVYYGKNNPNSASLMRKMAAVGMGRFLDVNVNGRSFPINDLVLVPGQVCVK